MQILTFSSLYPSRSRPSHGVFVEHRLRKLVATGRIASTVVCPVPWFFSTNSWFGDYAKMAATPLSDSRHGVEVHYPRYFSLPKLGMNLAPNSIFKAVYDRVAALHAEKAFVAIDAHYFYPDGVAAAMLGEALGLPVVITARGTDVNLIPKYERPRERILWAADRARHVITVCRALKDELVALGADSRKITVLRNGVDLDLFRPLDRDAVRAKHGLRRRTLLSVGHLIPRKGHDIVLRAVADIPEVNLLIAGDGPESEKLRKLAADLGISDRVTFLGEVSQHTLGEFYSAADALILASSREGWANVLLEAMACGTPVIASNVWGTPEVVEAPEAGVLMEARTPPALVAAYHRLFANAPDRADTRRYAEKFSWQTTTEGQVEIFEAVRREWPYARAV